MEVVEARRKVADIHAAALWVRRGSRRCSSCKAQVTFARHRHTGRWLILDRLPDWRKGNLLLEEAWELLVEVYPSSDMEDYRAKGGALFIDHHATCPYADQHREKK